MTEVTTLSKLAEPEIKQEEMKRVEPVAPPPPALKSSITVSYTHLDVYKRQVVS